MALKYDYMLIVLLTILLTITAVVALFNSINLTQINKLIAAGIIESNSGGNYGENLKGISGRAVSDTAGGRVVSDVAVSDADVVPTGTPKVYGEELGVSFDDVTPYDPQSADLAIRKLANLDNTIKLSGAEKQRYIDVLYNLGDGISCEYCCGARSVITANGDPACGCAHSFAMRGLAKYLITQHAHEYSDEEILEEVGKWKILFFPSQIRQKAALLEAEGIDPGYINLASNKYRGIEQGAGRGMVGGC